MDEDQFIGEIRLFAGTYMPPGDWAFCDGSLLRCEDYVSLFHLIGTRYGGDGVTNFALPDLRSRVPLGQSQRNPVGHTGGSEFVELPLDGLPAHRHTPACSTADRANTQGAGNAFWSGAAEGGRRYAPKDVITSQMGIDSIRTEGEGQPHENRIPVLAVSYFICTLAVFPELEK